MAHGAPESLDDIASYLGHIMKGRPPSQEIIEEVRERYRLVGGKSPLLKICRQQADALEVLLNKEADSFQVTIGMRHWHPFINDTVKEIVADGTDLLVAISLAPQYSKLSVGAYSQTLQTALADAGGEIPVNVVQSWHDQCCLLDAFSERLKDGLAGYSEKVRPNVQILFTAHSLPAQVLAEGDPYPAEVSATVEGIVKRLNLGPKGLRWQFAYQSQGFRPGKWLGPEVDEIIDDLANRGVSDLLVVPIGFVSDHVEILYDIDILYKGLAASKGIALRRTRSLNTAPLFIEALAAVVRSNLVVDPSHK